MAETSLPHLEPDFSHLAWPSLPGGRVRRRLVFDVGFDVDSFESMDSCFSPFGSMCCGIILLLVTAVAQFEDAPCKVSIFTRKHSD